VQVSRAGEDDYTDLLLDLAESLDLTLNTCRAPVEYLI
jgi:hypothetical protein